MPRKSNKGRRRGGQGRRKAAFAPVVVAPVAGGDSEPSAPSVKSAPNDESAPSAPSLDS